MYSIIKNVIESKNYELADMLTKIDTIWLQSSKVNGGITDEEKAELIALARQNAEVRQSIDILAKLEELDKRVRANEEIIKKLTEIEEGIEDGEEKIYEEYVSGRWCKNGDIFTFEGKVVKCIAPEGVTCVWSPSEYPDYWEEVVEDAPLTE